MCIFLGMFSGIILGMGLANERRYIVIASFIDWAYTQNDPCGLQHSSVYNERALV